MSFLRGGQQIWSPTGNGAAVLQNSKSALAVASPGPYVAVFISADQGGTYAVQVAPVASPRAGRNALDSSTPDGGLTWYDYKGADALAVTANVPIAFDLGPFSPQHLRLIRKDAGVSAVVTAYVTTFGPN